MARPKLEDRPSTVASERSGRPKRVPIHGQRSILDVEGKDPNFHYCWVFSSDAKSNTHKFLRAGYEFVTHDVIVGDVQMGKTSGLLDGKISVPAGGADRGVLILMRLPIEDYKSDMAALEADTNKVDAMMKANVAKTKDGMYGGKLEMTNRLGRMEDPE